MRDIERDLLQMESALAAGNANQHLAPTVGLSSPMTPAPGQILVTERTASFLSCPASTVRQTDEGTVMIDDSYVTAPDSAGMTLDVNFVLANWTVRMFPRLARLKVVRSWRAVRVLPKDGFPIYDQSTSHPEAFVAGCHSGVTLAAAHALYLAPMIAAGKLDAGACGRATGHRLQPRRADRRYETASVGASGGADVSGRYRFATRRRGDPISRDTGVSPGRGWCGCDGNRR